MFNIEWKFMTIQKTKLYESSFHNQFHAGIRLLTLFVKYDSNSHANAKSMGFMYPIHELMANFADKIIQIFYLETTFMKWHQNSINKKYIFCFNLVNWDVKNMSY
jgi:hypothetical protein